MGIKVKKIKSSDTLEIDDIKNCIINADATKVLKKMPKNSIDLVVTSPPYDDLRDYNDDLVWSFKVFKNIAK
jgi:DNA modification methylase